MKKILIFLLSVLSCSLFAFDADTLQVINSDVQIKAVKLTESIVLDGNLDEAVWNIGSGFENFIQRDPLEGVEPTERTVIRIAYDNNALYLGASMYDTSPDSIIARLARRDEWVSSDHITLFLDPYYDKRSGYFFAVNAAGTLVDGVLFNDTWDDESWDGVWEGKVHLNEKGWTAEMRIPFSQMRFSVSDKTIWGVNIRRNIGRKNEQDYLVFVPKNENGFVSYFAELVGMDELNSPSQVEFLPYITGRAEYIKTDEANPFNSGSNYVPGAGLDFKMGVGSNLTLNGTVNPDFGQVEIDPAVINLSDVETFFPERRPFFVEGSTNFNFGYGGAQDYWGFNWGSPDFFYSRRIGREPYGSVPDDADYEDYPSGTHILGAAKLTGKIGGSWNFGTIQSLTKREYAGIQTDGVQSETEVEPLAYYGVIRTQKEFDEGSEGLGMISTLSLRDFNDVRLEDEFNKSAITLGLDGWTFLDSSKTWVLAGWTGISNVSGNNQRMIDLQRSSRHYFQRPDASHVNVDSTANSLTGFAGRLHLNKQKGNFFINSAFGFITPGFDVNDLGFFFRGDVLNAHFGAGYKWTTPTDIYREMVLGGAFFRSYDFGGNITWQGLFHFGFMQFPNYYIADWDAAIYPETMNNSRTRGGPITLNPSSFSVGLFLRSDRREDWVVHLYGNTWQNGFSNFLGIGFGIEFRPLPNISFSISPGYDWNYDYSQYIDTYNDPTATQTYGKRYVFGELDQKIFSSDIRLNWIFNPSLSLQLYVQPLISTGKYVKYKELDMPGTYNFNNYGEGESTFDEENFIADPDGEGPADEIDIGNNDYDFISLRGNAVLRWEYLPGSIIYFVWTQSRTDEDEKGNFIFGDSFNRMVSIQPDNIFMVKFTYWFHM